MTPEAIFAWFMLGALIINGVASLVVTFKISETKDVIIERKQADIDSLKLQIPSFMAEQNRAVNELADQNHKRLTGMIKGLQRELAKAREDNESNEEIMGGFVAMANHLLQTANKAHDDIASLETDAVRLGALFEAQVVTPSPVHLGLKVMPPTVTTSPPKEPDDKESNE